MKNKKSSLNSFDSKEILNVGEKKYTYFSLNKASKNGLTGIEKLPRTIKILLENLLRLEDGNNVTKETIEATANWAATGYKDTQEISFMPARVLMQDFTGIPAIVDLAALRDAAQTMEMSANLINPKLPVDLVVDHSVSVDHFGTKEAFKKNIDLEYHRNKERYEFLRWGADSFDNLRLVPPGMGICHQINLEYLAKGVWIKEEEDQTVAYPDTVVGTDSHTTMINSLGVVGWGVGGIEAESAMLGQPISMLLPKVVGIKTIGKRASTVTATDIVLTLTELLRKVGVVGKFVEFHGNSLSSLSLEDRATISNMAPEYGATCSFFPTDDTTIDYLKRTAREKQQIDLIKEYCLKQNIYRKEESVSPIFSEEIEFDLSQVVPCIAGPSRPQDRIPINKLTQVTKTIFSSEKETSKEEVKVSNDNFKIKSGDVVIAAITSCTNTSNPNLLIGAGILARKAIENGLQVKPWVKTSLAPGSKVVTDYLDSSGLQESLNILGFSLVGYGCTTCIGNSGPLSYDISKQIKDNNLSVCSVLSGNRNFEGRINPEVKASFLASPMLVIAYALAGTVLIDLTSQPLGYDNKNNPVYFKDLLPSKKEVADINSSKVSSLIFSNRYSNILEGDEQWKLIELEKSDTFNWKNGSTYIRRPSFFDTTAQNKHIPGKDIKNASILALFGDSITTDHISPAGAIRLNTPAADYLISNGIEPSQFNSYGSRRGNHEVMMRGTFANNRIKNKIVKDTEGGYTIHFPTQEKVSIYDAAIRYKSEDTPLIILSGKEYGTGSSRDWAAKGPSLLGIKAVIAQSFERIHRSNLIGMGILPLELPAKYSWDQLITDGSETISIEGITKMEPRSMLHLKIKGNNSYHELRVLSRIDTPTELKYFKDGGILNSVLLDLKKENT